jgi:hypothetical protein
MCFILDKSEMSSEATYRVIDADSEADFDREVEKLEEKFYILLVTSSSRGNSISKVVRLIPNESTK